MAEAGRLNDSGSLMFTFCEYEGGSTDRRMPVVPDAGYGVGRNL